MAQNRALGESGGAAGVLDLGRIARLHLRQTLGALAHAMERSPVPEVHDFPDRLQALDRLRADGGHRIGAVALDPEQRHRTGLLQHIAKLLLLERRIDGHQHEPGQAAGVFHEYPFGEVVRPDRHPLPRREARGESQRKLLGFGRQLAVGPAPRRLAFDGHLHQGGGAGVARRDLAQLVADGGLPDRLVGLRGEQGFGQGDLIHVPGSRIAGRCAASSHGYGWGRPVGHHPMELSDDRPRALSGLHEAVDIVARRPLIDDRILGTGPCTFALGRADQILPDSFNRPSDSRSTRSTRCAHSRWPASLSTRSWRISNPT